MATVEHKDNGSVKITVSNGYDTLGKQIRHRMVIPANELANLTEKQKQKEIERQKVLFEQKVRNGTFLDGEKLTFGEFAEIWLRDYAEKELSPSTLNPYKFRLEKRILPALGHIKLSKLQPHHILSFYNNLSEAGIRLDALYTPTNDTQKILDSMSDSLLGEKTGVYRKTFSRIRKGKGVYKDTAQKISDCFDMPFNKAFIEIGSDKPLSGKTIRHHHILLSSILSTAVKWNVIQSSPAERVKPLKMPKAVSAITENYYGDEEVLKLFIALEEEPIKYKTIIYLAIDTGLRLSELAGLKWADINLDEKQLFINKQRQYVSHYGIFEKDPKSQSGIRDVTISDMVIDMLKKYLIYQKSMRIQLGSAWYPSNNVFIHEDGKPMFPHRPSIWFSEFLNRKELPRITFHGLRHTNASLLIAEGVDIVTLSRRLGHADKNVTLNTYSHIIKSKEKQAANKMDNFYSRLPIEKMK